MRLKVPITGTVKDFDPELAKLGHGVVGDDNDPVRIFVDLGDVSWQLVDIDLENGLFEIEVSGSQQVLAKAQHIIESKTVEEHYASSGAKRLLKPDHVMKKYRAFKGSGNDTY